LVNRSLNSSPVARRATDACRSTRFAGESLKAAPAVAERMQSARIVTDYSNRMHAHGRDGLGNRRARHLRFSALGIR
jgi:hypothetical protein